MKEKRHQPPLARLDRPLTLVTQVEQALRRAIAEQAFPDGRLPTEVELADRFGVSRETVRREAEVLQEEGLLRKHRRRGTVISADAPSMDWPQQTASQLLAYVQADYRALGGRREEVTTGAAERMLQGAIEESGRADYELIVRSTSPDGLRKTLDELLGRYRIRGAVLASFAEAKALRRLGGRELPVVLLDHDLHLPKTSSVRDDSAAGSRLAVEHLASLGHRRIAYAHWHQADLNPWRLRGYRDGLRAAQIRARRHWEFMAELTASGAELLVERLLSIAPQPTALICFNNTLARLAIAGLHRRGLQVPSDMSVVGCGGEEVMGLTTCQNDWHDLGCRAVHLLLRQWNDPAAPVPVEHDQLAPQLRLGETTGTPAL